MNKTKLSFAISVLILATLACNASLPTTQPPPTVVVIIEPTAPPQKNNLPFNEASVPRVEVEAAKAAFDTGAAIIVDVRSQQAYAASHIPGALNIQLGEFETNISGIVLAKDQWIITYCT